MFLSVDVFLEFSIKILRINYNTKLEGKLEYK